MSDRELLELAARAARYEIKDDYLDDDRLRITHDAGLRWQLWNPLTNNGDAFMLMVQLKLRVTPASDTTIGLVDTSDGKTSLADHCLFDGDPFIATRRAIVRAAAEIGKLK